MSKPKVVAFIPVRAGSKSIPTKNIKPLAGQPLVYWTCQAAQSCASVDQVVVATDSEAITAVVRGFNFSKVAIYHREPANATDTASTESVMLEYLGKANLTDDAIFLLIQATSPLLESTDIEAGLKLLQEDKYDSFLSCVRIKRFFWGEDGQALNYDIYQRPRRQEFAGTLVENGAVYGSTVANILRTKNRISGRVGIVEMNEASFYEIDEPEDWIIVEQLLLRTKARITG